MLLSTILHGCLPLVEKLDGLINQVLFTLHISIKNDCSVLHLDIIICTFVVVAGNVNLATGSGSVGACSLDRLGWLNACRVAIKLIVNLGNSKSSCDLHELATFLPVQMVFRWHLGLLVGWTRFYQGQVSPRSRCCIGLLKIHDHIIQFDVVQRGCYFLIFWWARLICILATSCQAASLAPAFTSFGQALPFLTRNDTFTFTKNRWLTSRLALPLSKTGKCL